LRAELVYDVYLPPCYYETGRRYPFVLLMHGADQDEKIWTDALKIGAALEAGLALKALPPFVLVMPRGGELANLNIFRAGAGWESVILDELLPHVEQNLCTWNERDGRAVGGISRGGFWAFVFAMRHPELFGAVGGHSPAFYWQNNAPAAYNPLYMARDQEFPPGLLPRMWVDIGADDRGRETAQEFQQMLAARGIEIDFTLNPAGDHTAAYWAEHISEYLTFYAQTWPRNVQDLPSCLD
jgi:enterochelin esterase-like enzyme